MALNPAADVYVIIVTFNGRKWIDGCLGSLRASTLSHHVIVVDNASSDGTADHVRDVFPSVELVVSQQNLGFGQANDRGLRIALDRGATHVFLLNQDAYVKPGTLQLLVKASLDHPGFGVLSPMHLNGAGTALDQSFLQNIAPKDCPGLVSDLILDRTSAEPYPVTFVNAAAWLITRECLVTVGGFSPTFYHYAEDDNYIHRTKFHGLLTGVLATAWIHHDREDRPPSEIWDDPDRIFLRRAMLRYSDPAGTLTVEQEARYKLRQAAVEMLMLNWKEARQLMHLRKLLRKLDGPLIERNRRISRIKGPTFL